VVTEVRLTASSILATTVTLSVPAIIFRDTRGVLAFNTCARAVGAGAARDIASAFGIIDGASNDMGQPWHDMAPQ
jgi:hypothetical protein